jgi:hypothetical protein
MAWKLGLAGGGFAGKLAQRFAPNRSRKSLTVACRELAWPNGLMRPVDLRAFARRDWGRAERAKLEYWIHHVDANGVASAVRAADALRKHVERFASFEAKQERVTDLAHHIQLKQRINAASRKFRR